jgi:phthalate 4,5-dioxygenase
MLSQADNERLTRVGAGTPMGTFFRRYWIPAALSEEFPEPDGAPVRLRILGEDLVGFRDTEGNIGIVSAFCPHRRAPLFFGRNEECGIRCVYHGWKFDRTGACVDMPSEPPDSLFKTKVTVEAYPAWEGGGMVWTYMGPPELQPPPPDHELVRAPANHRHVGKMFEDCNFLQALEGGIDPTHATILHNVNIGDRSFLNRYDELVASLDIAATPYGLSYAGIRAHDDFDWVRIYNLILPSFHMRGSVDGLFQQPGQIPTMNGHIWIPIDDYKTWVYSFTYSADPNRPISQEHVQHHETRLGRGDNTGPGYIPVRNRSNDYLIDRQLQKTQSMTGIAGVNTQDYALQEGMGAICDRTKEHVGTTDRAIIFLRKVLLDALTAMENGDPLPGADPSTYRHLRAVDRKIPKNTEWKVVCEPDTAARF